jgi:hypothetical protein
MPEREYEVHPHTVQRLGMRVVIPPSRRQTYTSSQIMLFVHVYMHVSQSELERDGNIFPFF